MLGYIEKLVEDIEDGTGWSFKEQVPSIQKGDLNIILLSGSAEIRLNDVLLYNRLTQYERMILSDAAWARYTELKLAAVENIEDDVKAEIVEIAGEPLPGIVSMSIEPVADPIVIGNTYQLVVKGQYDDDSEATIDPEDSKLNFFSTSTVFDVDSTGLVTAKALGQGVITVTYKFLDRDIAIKTASVSVTGISLSVSEITDTDQGDDVQLAVEAESNDGSSEDVTSESTFVSSDEEVVTVSESGLVSIVGIGSATVDVSYEGFTESVAVEISASNVSVEVTPATATLDIDGTQQLSVVLNKSDSSSTDVSGSATYVSSTPAVASVSATGLVTALTEGTTTITATSEGLSDTCAVTVNPAEVPPEE